MISETRDHILGRSFEGTERKRSESKRQKKDAQTSSGSESDRKESTVQILASCIVLKNRGAERLHGLYAHLENCTGKAKREKLRTTNTERMRVYKRNRFVIGAARSWQAKRWSNPE